MKPDVDPSFDRLFDVAIEGLAEYDPTLQSEPKRNAIKLAVFHSWEAGSNQQSDYDRVRDVIERESERISQRYRDYEYAASRKSFAKPFADWMAEQLRNSAVFRVYHLTDTRDDLVKELSHNYALLDIRRDPERAAEIFRSPADDCVYRLVAEVRASSLDDVFRLTNTIEEYWWGNTEVRATFQGEGCRSTSVGDIVFDGAGQGHFCASVGWVEMNLADPQNEANKPAPQESAPEAKSESASFDM
jgi:hypothetical protein